MNDVRLLLQYQQQQEQNETSWIVLTTLDIDGMVVPFPFHSETTA
jgi:hypothetical protein